MHILSITFIFDRCLCSSAAVTPVKYEGDIHQVTSVLMIMKHCEINGMEEIDLVSPIPGLAQQCFTYCELSTKSTLATPSHYLIQFWLMIVNVQPSAIAENFQAMLATLIIWNDLFKDFYSSARGQWVNYSIIPVQCTFCYDQSSYLWGQTHCVAKAVFELGHSWTAI